MYGLHPSIGLTGVMLLYLKGAANLNTPDSLSVTVLSHGTEVRVNKGALLHAFQKVTKTRYVRRLAEHLRDNISKFAEANSIPGDLAQQLNTVLLSKDKMGLTIKQRAWASSFNQGNPSLETDPDLVVVAQLLARDYDFKFKKRIEANQAKKPKKTTSSPLKGLLQNQERRKKRSNLFIYFYFSFKPGSEHGSSYSN